MIPKKKKKKWRSKEQAEGQGWGGGDVFICRVTDPCECVRVKSMCLCAGGAAEPCQPLPHSSPLEQIACHCTSITHTHTPSSTKCHQASNPTPSARVRPERRVTRLLCPHPLSSSPTPILLNCCFLQARQLLLASHGTENQKRRLKAKIFTNKMCFLSWAICQS